jgi:hypothetical protein
MVRNYWRTVRQRVWRESLEAVRWDNWQGIAVAQFPLVMTAVATWWLLDDVAGVFVRFLAAVGATALLAALFFAAKMLTVAPHMHAEAEEQIAQLTARIVQKDRRAPARSVALEFYSKLQNLRARAGKTDITEDDLTALIRETDQTILTLVLWVQANMSEAAASKLSDNRLVRYGYSGRSDAHIKLRRKLDLVTYNLSALIESSAWDK